MSGQIMTGTRLARLVSSLLAIVLQRTDYKSMRCHGNAEADGMW